jgi:hypothetical protein
MNDQDPIKTAVRRRRKQERFGDVKPFCILCGNGTIETLARARLDWLEERIPPERLIELHHVVGENHDPNLVVPLCMNCHRVVTEGLARAGVSMLPEPEPGERVALMLDALAVFCQFLVDSLRKWAEFLRKSVAGEITGGQ